MARNITRLLSFGACTLCLITLGRYWISVHKTKDDRAEVCSKMSPERVWEVARQDIQRTGQLRYDTVFLDGEECPDQRVRVRYVLQSPVSETWDAEIRGMLDGHAKYLFNQGTAYHVRVGRRFDGEFHGEFELKRGLFGWSLSGLPPHGRVARVSLRFWLEQSPLGAPVADSWRFPLHLYAYPLSADWGPGQGGVKKDSFSAAAPGEVSWLQARTGERAWSAAGALDPDAAVPLAMTHVVQDDSGVTITSHRLTEYVNECLGQQRSLDVLLKLDDQEEDEWGTQFGLYSAEFNHEHPAVSLRVIAVDSQHTR